MSQRGPKKVDHVVSFKGGKTFSLVHNNSMGYKPKKKKCI